MDVGCFYLFFFRQPRKKNSNNQIEGLQRLIFLSQHTKIANMMDWPKCCCAKNMRIGRTADFSCFRSRKSQCEAAWFAISSEILQLFSSNGFRQSISPIKLFFSSRDRANREDAKNYLQSLSQRLDIHGPKTRREKQLKVANRAKKTTKINSPMTYFWNRRLSKPSFVRFFLMFELHVQKHRVLRIPDSKNNNSSDPITRKKFVSRSGFKVKTSGRLAQMKSFSRWLWKVDAGF